MKKIRLFAVVILFGLTMQPLFSQFSKFVESRPQIVKELKNNLIRFSDGVINYHGYCRYSICEYSVEDIFTKYSFKNGIDTILTNFALFEYYEAKTSSFLIITVLENSVTEIFVDFNFDGVLDAYISNGETFCGSGITKKQKQRLDIFLEFGARG